MIIKILFASFLLVALVGCSQSDEMAWSNQSVTRNAQDSSSQTNQTSSDQTSEISNDNCREQGEPFSSALANICGGTWNIYASISGGYTWFSNENDRDSVNINAQAERKREELRRCGIESYISLSDNFDEFTQDLVVVHSAPHSSNRVAAAELSRAGACGLQGYSKDSRYQVKVGD